MTRRAVIPQAEWDRAVKAAKKHLPVGSYKIVVENGHPAILPVAGSQSPVVENDDDSWDESLKRWRHSA